MKHLYLIIITIVMLMLTSCINPFAPTLSDSELYVASIGDQKTIDGFFQNFLYAYNMKDTIIYSNLISHDFVFSYRDYEQEINRTLSRTEDMMATYRLFNAAQNFSFVWNEIINETGTDTEKNIIRSFNLTITFNPMDIEYVTGKVHFNIKRNSPDDNWQLVHWQDDSYY